MSLAEVPGTPQALQNQQNCVRPGLIVRTSRVNRAPFGAPNKSQRGCSRCTMHLERRCGQVSATWRGDTCGRWIRVAESCAACGMVRVTGLHAGSRVVMHPAWL